MTDLRTRQTRRTPQTRRTRQPPTRRRRADIRREEDRERQVRTRGRWRQSALVALVAVVVALAGGLALRSGDDPAADRAASSAGGGGAAGAEQDTLLVLTARGPQSPATSAVLLAHGDDDAAAVLVPVSVLVDIPGVGPDRLARAHQFGGPDLVEASLENALLIEIDRTVSLPAVELGGVLAGDEGLQVALRERLVRRADDGTAEVAFEQGPTVLDPAAFADLWTFRGRGEDEVDVLPRRRQVLAAALDAPAVRLDALAGDPDRPDVAALAGALARQAESARQGGSSFDVLPVRPFGVRDEEAGAVYRVAEEEADALVARRLAGSRPPGASDAVRVQVLNGVGSPGVASAVDRALGAGPYRIVRSDNATSFEEPTTQIVVYEDSAEAREAARDVERRLGAGEILVSRQPQSVVDLTVVVGADFVVAEQRP